ncbi:MAG: dephospho-CoA kinase [Clostridia bacterium]|nr:dephospho-CoA kinase [Clostridia bacterium]
MTLIAITGGIACGKSTVAEWLRQEGAAVIDADAVSRTLTQRGGEALPLIRRTFGNEMFHPDGELDRARLAEKVFGDEKALAKLNGILHPLVLRRMEDEIKILLKAGHSTLVLDVPLLYEAELESMADWVVCISAPEELQIQRLIARDGLTRNQAEVRISSQWPLQEKERRADEVIHTDRPPEEVRAHALRMYAARAKAAAQDPLPRKEVFL